MYHTQRMEVTNPMDKLSKEIPRQRFRQLLPPPDIVEHIAPLADFHKEQFVVPVVRYQAFEVFDTILMAKSFQRLPFIVDSLLESIIISVMQFVRVYAFHCHYFSGQLMQGDVHFAIAASSQNSSQFIIRHCCARCPPIFFETDFDIFLNVPNFF